MNLFNRNKNIKTVDDQMHRRQSALKPTPEQEAQKMLNGLQMSQDNSGAIDGFQALSQVIGIKQIQAANQTLMKYKEGKANLEKRIIDNEQWYKLRHWECMRDKKQDVQPTSAWLFNCIANKHADAMDNFPSPNILPREEGDKGQAEMLTSIIPVILDQCDFEQTYSDVMQYKIKNGTGVYGIFWDKSKLNGLGDITIKKVDLINLFWESGITDIQRSRNLFHVELADNDLLIQSYPQLAGKLGNSTIDISQYVYDDDVDTSQKSVVVDWYYKKNQNGSTVLHYCKYVNDEVLFATENTPEFAEKGLYDHGEYPFVFDVLFPVEGMPTGFGYIDVGKDAQTYIDRGNQAIMQNMLANAKPRYFINNNGSVNDLNEKLREQRIKISAEIADNISAAAKKAFDAASQTAAVLRAFGDDDAAGGNTETDGALLDRVRENDTLKKISVMLGKYREIIADKRKNSFSYGLGEKYDITYGNDISNCLSSELALLGAPETEILFFKRYYEKHLQQYRRREPSVKGDGDIIVLADESSSTREIAPWVKAFALALMDIALHGNKKFALVHFANSRNVKTDVFESGKYTTDDVLAAAEHFFGGGTDFEAPLNEALRLLTNGFESADVVIITDGECEVSDEFAERFTEAKLKNRLTVTGILLSADDDCGKSLLPFCDKIYRLGDMSADEIALEVIGKCENENKC